MRLSSREVVRFDARRIEDWAVWTLRATLAAVGVWALAEPPSLQYTHPPLFVATVGASLAASAIVSSVVSSRPRTLRLVELGILVAFCVHLAGHLFDLYHRLPWYDTVLHAVSGFAAGMSAFGLSQATDWFWDWPGETPFRTFYLVVSFVALSAVTLEAVEFVSDRHLHTSEQVDPVQDPLTDTMIDIHAAMAGGLAAASLAALLTRAAAVRGAAPFAESPKRGRLGGSPRA